MSPVSASSPALPLLPGRIALIFGGVSPEHEVSIMSASQASAALGELIARGAALHAESVYINKDGRWIWRAGDGNPATEAEILAAPKWELEPDAHGVETLSFAQGLDRLAARGIEAALLILHGAHGEDGRLQGALDLAGIAYTGSGALASALCMNKPRCQAVLNAARLPIAVSVAAHRDQQITPEQLVNAVGLPMVIKPADGGSSVGMTIIREAGQIPAALELAFQTGDEALAEAFIKGSEFTAGVIERPLGPGEAELVALPIVQIVPPEGHYYDYEAKYFDERTQYLTPAPIPQTLTSRMQELALRAYRATGCRGYARVDFLCDVASAAEPTILELNTLPGMTAHSLLPKAAAAIGIDYPSLIACMLASARNA